MNIFSVTHSSATALAHLIHDSVYPAITYERFSHDAATREVELVTYWSVTVARRVNASTRTLNSVLLRTRGPQLHTDRITLLTVDGLRLLTNYDLSQV